MLDATPGFKLEATKGFLLEATVGLRLLAMPGLSEEATNGLIEEAMLGFRLDGIFNCGLLMPNVQVSGLRSFSRRSARLKG